MRAKANHSKILLKPGLLPLLLALLLFLPLLVSCGGGSGTPDDPAGGNNETVTPQPPSPPPAPGPQDPEPEPPAPDPPEPEPEPELPAPIPQEPEPEPPAPDPQEPEPEPPAPATFTVSGLIIPGSGNAVDGTVNDPSSLHRRNDTIADAQQLPNPVILGGYVNQPRRGPSGRSYLTGDIGDFYRADLLAGQQLMLLIAADGQDNDLDLYLANPAGEILDAAVGTGRIESLTVPATGEYLLGVEAYRGASGYILTIGQEVSPAGIAGTMRLSDPFLAGEALVLPARPPAAAAAAPDSGKGLSPRSLAAAGFARSREREDTPRNMRVDLRRLALQDQQENEPAAGRRQRHETGLRLSGPEKQAKLGTLEQIKALRREPEVTAAAPNYLYHSQSTPTDPFYHFQWHYPLISLPAAWAIGQGGGSIVAVIDTGVALDHPDLRGRLLPGYDFIQMTPSGADPGDKANPDGSSTFHGTHVSGTVAAAANNSVGVAGVAHQAMVMPLRALGRGGTGSSYDVEQAVRYAAGLANDSGTVPAKRADVINLSLGGPGYSEASQMVYDQARAAGVKLAAAAGNDNSNIPVYPAAYRGVLAVSAVDIERQRTPYSNFGHWIDLAGPGGNTGRDLNGDGYPDGVLSTTAMDDGGALTYNYSFMQGTSMAVPHVTGIIAMMKAIAPALGPADLENMLAAGLLSDDLGTAGRDDYFGHGLINAYKAVNAALDFIGGHQESTPLLAVHPPALSFGTTLSAQSLLVSNGGGGELTVSTIGSDAAGWLEVSPQSVNDNGLGSYLVTVNRAGLEPGVYTAAIAISSNAGSAEVRVMMQIADMAAGAIDRQYVLLIDPQSGATMAETAGELQPDGSYAFTLEGIEAGGYHLIAGADSDNNYYICETGESCGAYLTLEQPVTLVVDRNLAGIEFVSSIKINLAPFSHPLISPEKEGFERSMMAPAAATGL